MLKRERGRHLEALEAAGLGEWSSASCFWPGKRGPSGAAGAPDSSVTLSPLLLP